MFKRIALVLLLALFINASAWAQADLEDVAIEQVAAMPEFAEMLANYDNYTAEAFELEDDLWEVEFYIDLGEDFQYLGYAIIALESGDLLASYIPVVLSIEELAELEPRVLALAQGDPEIAAVVTNPAEWTIEAYYVAIEQGWEVYFERGLEAWTVWVVFEESEATGEREFYIAEVYNETQLESYQAEADRRDRAVMLAFDAPGADDALATSDDWTTLVQMLSDMRYTVEFVAGDARLFCAEVDIATEQVLGTC